jgi:hypothetical protein
LRVSRTTRKLFPRAAPPRPEPFPRCPEPATASAPPQGQHGVAGRKPGRFWTKGRGLARALPALWPILRRPARGGTPWV